MSWSFPNFLGGSQPQQNQPNYQENTPQSWYPPSVLSGSSRPPTTASSSSASANQSPSDFSRSSLVGQASAAEAAGIILRDKSIDELRKLLNDKVAYNAFFNSLETVKTQNDFRDDLQKGILQLARENLDKEHRLSELRNQCTIIRTTQLASAQDRLTELERQKDELMNLYSPTALVEKLHDSMVQLDEESELLHRRLLEKDIDLPSFIQKYKNMRITYHRKALLHLASKTSLS